jgi:polysaccharide transporter, PST family
MPTPLFSQVHEINDLKRRSIRSGALTLISQAGSLGIQMATIVIMARLLTPADFGIVAMVTAIIGMANLFKDLGLSSATIQKDKITHAQLSALFWINTCMGVFLMVAVAALSPVIAWFYRKPELIAVTLGLSIAFPLTSLSTQHRALLTRNMRFGSLALINISSLLAGLIVGVIVALSGGRYWALVISNLTICVWGTLGAWIAYTQFRPALIFRNSGIRELLFFGANITAFDFVNYFHRNLDNILIGRVWGVEPLGLYSKAYALLMLPINNIRGPLNSVAFPALSRLQGDPDLFRRYYSKFCFILALVSMPVATFLYLGSDRIIRLLLGDQWMPASSLFSILALCALIQPVASLRGLVLISCGKGGRYFRWGLYNAIATSTAFVCGLPWGAMGVAIAYTIVTYLILHPSLIYVSKGTPVNVNDFYFAVARPFVASIIMGCFGMLLFNHLQIFQIILFCL